MNIHHLVLSNRSIVVIQPTDSRNFGDHIQFLDTLNALAHYGRLTFNRKSAKADIAFIIGHTFGYGVDLWNTVKIAKKVSRRVVLLPSSMALYRFDAISKRIDKALSEIELVFVRGIYSYQLIRELYPHVQPYVSCDQVLNYFAKKMEEYGIANVENEKCDVVGVPRYDYALIYPRKSIIERVCEIVKKSSRIILVSETDYKIAEFFSKNVLKLSVKNIYDGNRILNILRNILNSVSLVITMRFHFGIVSAVLNVPTVFVNPIYEYKALDVLGRDNIKCLIDIHYSIDKAEPKPCTFSNSFISQNIARYKRMLDMIGELL